MSTEMNPAKSEGNEEVQMNSFWGGNSRGACVQMTQSTGYVQMTKEQARQVRDRLNDWLEDFRLEEFRR